MEGEDEGSLFFPPNGSFFRVLLSLLFYFHFVAAQRMFEMGETRRRSTLGTNVHRGENSGLFMFRGS